MKTIKDCFHSVCSRYGEKKAITIFRAGRPETEISYTRLDQYCNQMAVALMRGPARFAARTIGSVGHVDAVVAADDMNMAVADSDFGAFDALVG